MPGFYPRRSTRSMTGSGRNDHKNLLEDERSISPTANEPASADSLLDSIVITATDYVYPREDEVPSGYYFSEISRVSAREKGNSANTKKVLLDICYDLEGFDYKNRGKIFKIKQSYPIGSEFAQKFFDAMIKAGVKAGANPKDLVGTKEKIRLEYWSKNSDIGSIVERVPFNPSLDDEDDDDAAATDVQKIDDFFDDDDD